MKTKEEIAETYTDRTKAVTEKLNRLEPYEFLPLAASALARMSLPQKKIAVGYTLRELARIELTQQEILGQCIVNTRWSASPR